MSTICNYGMRWGVIEQNPFVGMMQNKKDRDVRTTIFRRKPGEPSNSLSITWLLLENYSAALSIGAVVRRVECGIVIPVVAGSSPVSHPRFQIEINHLAVTRKIGFYSQKRYTAASDGGRFLLFHSHPSRFLDISTFPPLISSNIAECILILPHYQFDRFTAIVFKRQKFFRIAVRHIKHCQLNKQTTALRPAVAE